MTEKGKVKECPFCGGEAEIIHINQGNWEGYTPRCKGIVGCILGRSFVWYDTEQEALYVWNRRVNKQGDSL